MTEETPLTREDALILLDEFDDILPELETGRMDEESATHVRKLVASLRRLPLPDGVREEHMDS